jgi:hypothetical protein
MAGQEIMKTESDIPRLEGSPFAPTEVVNGQDLSAEDHSFLQKREKIIEAGRKTFLEVGGALIDIHDYRSGLLYKRHGSFDAYCKQRWDLGRAHAYRLMEAAEIYAGMSPRGDITEGKTIMPTTEKQLRPLKKLPPKLRLEAWKNAVTAAGPKPVAARHVETEVRKLMTEEGNKPAAKSNKTGPLFHRLAEGDAEKIRALLAKIRKSVASGVVKRIPDWLDEVNALLPGS